jgi:AraC-like DNA-binding protein
MFIGSYETFEDQQQPQFRLSCIDNLLYIPHLHRQYELIYVQEGEMTAHIDGAAQFLSAGECSLATSHKLHSYANNQPGKFYMAIFEPELVPLFSSTLRKNDLASPFVQPRAPAQRSEFIHLIGRIFEAGTTDPVAISGYMTALLAQISAHTGLVPQHRNPRPTLLQQVLEYVAQHYNEGSITLESTARALGLSHYYLSRFFNQQTGYSFPVYVMHFRINSARSLLERTDRSIGDIALECGFECTRSFNRAFQRILGMSPSQFRKQIR